MMPSTETNVQQLNTEKGTSANSGSQLNKGMKKQDTSLKSCISISLYFLLFHIILFIIVIKMLIYYKKKLYCHIRI